MSATRSADAQSATAKFPLKRFIGLIAGIAALIVFSVLPGTPELSHMGLVSLGILLCAIIWWCCDTFPIGITAVICTVFLFLFGVSASLPAAFEGYAQANVWFLFGIFCFTAIMFKTTIGQRLIRVLCRVAGANPKSIILAYMVATAILSMFMTNPGAVAVAIALALPLLKDVDAMKTKPNFGRCMCLGIAAAACIGGNTTPFGHSMNVLCGGLFESTYGMPISFFQWFVPGIICCVILLPVAWLIFCKIFPPEPLSEEEVEAAAGSKIDNLGKWSSMDVKGLLLIVVCLALFVLSNWFSFLNTTAVIIIVLAVMFLPGLDMITWKDFQEVEGWNAFLMVGGIMSLSTGVSSTGAGEWLGNLFLNSGVMNIPVFLGLLALATLIYVLHTFCPTGPAFCALFVPPLMTYCVAVGISPAIFCILMAALVTGSFIMPFNPPNLIAYSEGYFSIGDMVKTGIPTAIVYLIVETAVIYFVGGLMLPLV